MITAEDRQRYTVTKETRTASGRPSVDCGDEVATLLRGKTDADLAHIAEKNNLKDRWDTVWARLKEGHRRMCLGNALRQIIKKGGTLVH